MRCTQGLFPLLSTALLLAFAGSAATTTTTSSTTAHLSSTTIERCYTHRSSWGVKSVPTETTTYITTTTVPVTVIDSYTRTSTFTVTPSLETTTSTVTSSTTTTTTAPQETVSPPVVIDPADRGGNRRRLPRPPSRPPFTRILRPRLRPRRRPRRRRPPRRLRASRQSRRPRSTQPPRRQPRQFRPMWSSSPPQPGLSLPLTPCPVRPRSGSGLLIRGRRMCGDRCSRSIQRSRPAVPRSRHLPLNATAPGVARDGRSGNTLSLSSVRSSSKSFQRSSPL
jgi:hypothetical protein